MRSTGIKRKVDDLGRVVIPAGVRRSLGIREGDALEVMVEGDQVILAKPRDRCVFCGGEDGPLQSFRGRVVCRPCVASVAVLDDGLRERGATGPAAAPSAPATAVPAAEPAATPAPAPVSSGPATPPEPPATTREHDWDRELVQDPASTTAW